MPLDPPAEPPLDADNVQGGIVSAYTDVHHGCLLLLGFEGPAALAALLKVLPFTSEAHELEPGQIATNISFTVEGLRVAGLSDDEVRLLPRSAVWNAARASGICGSIIPIAGVCRRSTGIFGVDAPDLVKTTPPPASTSVPFMRSSRFGCAARMNMWQGRGRS